MHFVYLLHHSKYKKCYVGCTKNIQSRIKDHKAGRVEYTSGFHPTINWELVYAELYPDQAIAFARERQLKAHANGLIRIKKRLGIYPSQF